MLIGVAGLGAWGLYRFYQILNEKNAAIPSDMTGTERALEQAHNLLPSFAGCTAKYSRQPGSSACWARCWAC